MNLRNIARKLFPVKSGWTRFSRGQKSFYKGTKENKLSVNTLFSLGIGFYLPTTIVALICLWLIVDQIKFVKSNNKLYGKPKSNKQKP